MEQQKLWAWVSGRLDLKQNVAYESHVQTESAQSLLKQAVGLLGALEVYGPLEQCAGRVERRDEGLLARAMHLQQHVGVGLEKKKKKEKWVERTKMEWATSFSAP